MAQVLLGNVSHTATLTDPETGQRNRFRSAHVKQSTTVVNLAEDKLFPAMRDVLNVWANESDKAPAWVDCPEFPALEAALREHFEVGGRPEGWEHIFEGESRLVPYEPQAESAGEPATEPATETVVIGGPDVAPVP